MNAIRTRNLAPPRLKVRGFSLIELSVAMVIALFLLGGMLTLLQDTRRTTTDQSQLAQLQDEERVAMTMITDTIQQAGYYANPESTNVSAALPADSSFAVGQAVTGTTGGAYGDTVTVRYQGDSTSSVLDCVGGVIANGTTEEMQFSVQADAHSNLRLVCTINGTATPLVSNVQSLTIEYGVDVSGTGSVSAYLPASSMTSAYWSSVDSVKITVVLGNPYAGQADQSSTIAFTRVIGVMSKTGVNVLNFT
ncbi:MAG: PilW family protein [Steroidobacteraceae bacterium]